MTSIFLMVDDEFTCVFRQHDPAAESLRPQRVDFRNVGIYGGDEGIFLTAAAVINAGERRYRGIVQRKTKKKVRNIGCRHIRAARLLGWAQKPDGMTGADGKEKRKMMAAWQTQLDGLVAEVRNELGLADEGPSRWSYVITADVLSAARNAGCESVFEGIEGQRFFAADLAKIETRINETGAEAAPVMDAIRKSRNDEHLAMISLSASKDEVLYLTLVDQEGHLLKVEASRFAEMIGTPGESRRLHSFPPFRSREPVEFAFNSQSQGEIVGRFLPGEMRIDVVCCEVRGTHGNITDKCWFYPDPEYLACLWVVLGRLGKDRERYRELQTKAEARVEFDPFAAQLL